MGKELFSPNICGQIACLMVVFGHIYLVGPNDPNTLRIWIPTVSTYIFGPDPNIENPYGQVMNLLAIHTGIGLGALGVGIFFLISGFVILRALDREPWRNFLARRVFRIFPTNIAAVLCVSAIITTYCYFHNVANPISKDSVIFSSLVLTGFTHDFTAIPVLWTLEVELVFYLLMALLASIVGHISRGTLLIASSSIMCLVILLSALSTSLHSPEFLHVSNVMTNVNMLLAGSMIYRNVSSGLTSKSWIFAGLSIGIFILTYAFHGLLTSWSHTGVDAINIAVSFIFFVAALWSGMEWRWLMPLKWFSKISYPLYLIHIPLGWLILVLLAKAGWGIHTAGIAALLVVVSSAAALHLAIEKPFQKAGSKIANSLFPRN